MKGKKAPPRYIIRNQDKRIERLMRLMDERQELDGDAPNEIVIDFIKVPHTWLSIPTSPTCETINHINNQQWYGPHVGAGPCLQRSDNMPSLHVVHSDTRWIGVAFMTIVVRNSAIKAKYPGGMRAFSEQNGPRCNNDISVFCFMGDDADDVYKDLRHNGLKPGKDVAVLDLGRVAIAIFAKQKSDPESNAPRFINTGVPWLRCRDTHDGFFVS